MTPSRTRRQFLKQTAAIGAAAAVGAGEPVGADEQSPAKMPTIQLGTLEVSRLILGSNPFFGFAHGNPQGTPDQMQAFYTQDRIMAVMDEAADHGITAVWTPSYDHWIRLWNRYREKGGRLRIWIGQPDPPPEQMKDHITAAAKNGAKAVCIQGERIDAQFRQKQFDVVREWLDHIHRLGLPAGIAAHRPETHLAAEEQKLPTDFYHQCVYQPENYSQTCRDQAIATMKQLDKPVVAYKVLAAGRLAPKEAFTHLLKHLRRKDGLCVGVFPKKNRDEIAENVALARRLTSGAVA